MVSFFVINDLCLILTIFPPISFALKMSGACTVNPILCGHSKIDKTKVLKTDGSLVQVEKIAECSLAAFCNTLGLSRLH